MLLLSLIAMAIFLGSPLEEPANPADVNYVPRPEWYFYFLFELLWFFPGAWIVMPVVVIPVAAIAVLVFLPFFDRGAARHPARRPVAVALASIGMALVIFLTYKGAVEPAAPTDLPLPPVPGEVTPQVLLGREVYQAQGCASCHAIAGRGSAAGPDLSKIGARRDREWLLDFIRDPRSINPGSIMPGYNLEREKLEALVEFLQTLR